MSIGKSFASAKGGRQRQLVRPSPSLSHPLLRSPTASVRAILSPKSVLLIQDYLKSSEECLQRFIAQTSLNSFDPPFLSCIPH